MSITERIEEQLYRARLGRPYTSRSARMSAMTRAIRRAGYLPYRAEYDAGKNCVDCGEAGRCPGVHALPEMRPRLI